jgi:CHAD domain-containing protein
MSQETAGLPLLERYRVLDCDARLARAGLVRDLSIATGAVYDLRLNLRILRIIKRFVRKCPDCIGVSPLLDSCYRATSRVRDLQVGIERIQQLELGWPRNRRRPSTVLKSRLKHEYRALALEVDRLGLEQVLQGLDRAFLALSERVTDDKLHRRALEHAQKLDERMLKRMHVALERQRETDWHALRLAIKQCRFWITTLADWLPEEYRIEARALKPLQVALGNFNDWVVLEKWLPEVTDAPLESWLPQLALHKQQALASARQLLPPLMSRRGLHTLA